MVGDAGAQLLRGDVEELDLVGGGDDRVGHRLVLGDAGDCFDGVVEAVDVLHVERGDHIDTGGQQLLHVFPAFLVAAARHAGVGQFIDQHHPRTSSQHLVHVELVEDGPSAADLGERNLLQRGEHGLGIRALVGLDQTHDHIHSPLSQALGLGQHGVGLSDSRSNTEIDAQPTSARRRCRTRRHSAAHRDHPSLPHVGSNLQLAKGAHEGRRSPAMTTDDVAGPGAVSRSPTGPAPKR